MSCQGLCSRPLMMFEKRLERHFLWKNRPRRDQNALFSLQKENFEQMYVDGDAFAEIFASFEFWVQT